MAAEFTLSQVEERVNAQWSDVVALLKKKIALKSVSALGITAEHMKNSAQFVADELTELGVSARVVQSTNPDGTPGAWEVVGSKMVSDSAPTVLLYAHHDVQPVPDASVWSTDPFEGIEKGDRLYGRGSADDGGGIAIHAGALGALGNDLGVNIKVFFEGEEEMGSESFIPFITAHRDDFDADVIIVADSGNWSDEIPSLTTSLRGNADVDISLRVLEHPVHSGQFGGPILDANTVAALLIASMYDQEGNLIVEGLSEQEPVGGLQRDLDESTYRRDSSAVKGLKLAGSGTLASRLWVKPSVTVIGFDAHPVEGSFNVIAETSRFRLSLRTAPSQNPQEALDALKQHLRQHVPFGAQISFANEDAGKGWAMDAHSNVTKEAEKAMAEAFDTEPINKGEGGSIPFIPELQKLFPGAKVLVTGPEDPKSNAHSPNESISLPGLKKNIVTEALLLSRLANINVHE